MSKAKVAVAFGETPATSSKINNLITDYLTRGQLIISATGSVLATQTGLQDAGGVQFGPVVAIHDPFHLGWYPYNPAKQVYDRMRIVGSHSAADVNGDSTTAGMNLQYSLDSGTGWTTANLAEVAVPISIVPPQGGTGVLSGGADDVDITGISAFQWIGLRFEFSVAPQVAAWCVFAFLYLSTDTPF